MLPETEPAARPVRRSWWKGGRGEWHVVIQLILMALVVFGPRSWPARGLPPFPGTAFSDASGIALMFAGGLLLLAGICWLGGRNITPLPYPREEATLVTSGPYRLVRHPMYSGGVLFAFGWAIWVRGPLTLAYAVALLAFADVKSRLEERWLLAKFQDYADYRRRVRKLIPFVY